MIIINKWFSIILNNPFKTWWKARKYFKCPKARFYIQWQNRPWHGKLLLIHFEDVIWKDKFDSPRYEISPHISVLLFGKLGFRINAAIYYNDEFGERQNGDMVYWEYLLEWLYYKKERTLRCYSTWTGNSRLYKVGHWGKAEDGSEDIYIPARYITPCVSMSLNKQGIKELKRELNEERGNT